MLGINSGRWNRTMLNLCGIVVANLKMVTGRIFRCQESIRDIIIYPHMKCRWNRTIMNLCGIVVAILKMATGRIFRCQESIRDIIIYPHMKWRWNRTMLNLCGIVVAILKMATGRNFSMSGINSGHHYLPMMSRIDSWHRKILPVAIFKMATTIPNKFNIVRFQRHFICG
jgi:hypothetical protein